MKSMTELLGAIISDNIYWNWPELHSIKHRFVRGFWKSRMQCTHLLAPSLLRSGRNHRLYEL